jgi:hypothetical protein
MSVNNAKPLISRIMYAAVITAIVFSVTLTFSACVGKKNESPQTFIDLSKKQDNTIVEELRAYLSKQPANTPDTPYKFKLDIEDNDIPSLRQLLRYIDKYLYLDLSNSTITTIPDFAFNYCNNLVGIIIPNGVTKIGLRAFESCYNLTSVIIPDNVTAICPAAFRNCESLANITIPNSVTVIEDRVFLGCGFVSITIPNNIKNIEEQAFAFCNNLVSVTVPNSVTSIGDGAFVGCKKLIKINIDFGNREYTAENGILYSKDKTVLHTYPIGKKDNSFTIPDNVITIGKLAFDGSKLTDVTIGKNVESIEDQAFKECLNFVGITIPDNVTRIGKKVFWNCYNLTGIVIPKSVTCIEREAFYHCTSLINITIPDSIINIGAEAFSGCTNLNSIIIPNSVTGIGKDTFWGCTNLTSVTFEGTIVRGTTYSYDYVDEDEYYDIENNNETFCENSFFGDLREKFYEEDAEKGTPGTYTTTAPVSEDSIWTRQP